jgi:hypothetical protein
MPASFIFLGDMLDMSEVTNCSINDCYTLKKANDEEIFYVKREIDSYSQILDFFPNRFEYKKAKTGDRFEYSELSNAEWNYWVIETSRIGYDRAFDLSLSLSSIDLTQLFYGSYSGALLTDGREIPGIQRSVLATINFFIDNPLYETDKKRISDNDVLEIARNYLIIQDFYLQIKKIDFIEKSIIDYIKIRDISAQSPFKVLSYFAILEHLLTSPRSRQNDNTITYQLCTKLNLLNNQFLGKLNHSSFFGGPDTNTLGTIIEKLYQYRSDIAHGNKADFGKKLFVLRDGKYQIQNFLKLIVRQVLLCSLTNPQLVSDLREC